MDKDTKEFLSIVREDIKNYNQENNKRIEILFSALDETKTIAIETRTELKNINKKMDDYQKKQDDLISDGCTMGSNNKETINKIEKDHSITKSTLNDLKNEVSEIRGRATVYGVITSFLVTLFFALLKPFGK